MEVDFRLGNASQMPFEDENFNFLVCRATFKNFAEPVLALQEMYRVVKPDGKALIIDLRRDAARDSIDQFVDGMGLNRVNAGLTKLTFRFMLLKRAYTRKELEQFISQTRFRTADISESLTGFEILLGK